MFEGRWRAQLDSPATPRGPGAAAILAGDPVFVDERLSVAAYSQEFELWKRYAPPPRWQIAHRFDYGIAVVGFELWVFGGRIQDDALDRVERLGADRLWTDFSEAAPMPEPAWHMGVAVLDGHIHVVGGFDGLGGQAIHRRFDPRTHSWTTCRPLPSPRWGLALVAFDGLLYAIGGDHGTPAKPEPCEALEVYDPITDSWLELGVEAPLPEPRARHAAVAVREGIVVVGGLGPTGSSAASWLYRPHHRRWLPLERASLQQPRYDFGLVAESEAVEPGSAQLYAIAGLDSPGHGYEYVRGVETFDLVRELRVLRAPTAKDTPTGASPNLPNPAPSPPRPSPPRPSPLPPAQRPAASSSPPARCPSYSSTASPTPPSKAASSASTSPTYPPQPAATTASPPSSAT